MLQKLVGCVIFETCFFLPPHMRFAVKNVKRIWWKDQREGRVWTAVMLDTHWGWNRRFKNNLITHTEGYSTELRQKHCGEDPHHCPNTSQVEATGRQEEEQSDVFTPAEFWTKTQPHKATAETPTHRHYCGSFRKWVTQACLILTLMPLPYETWCKFTSFLLTVYDLWTQNFKTADHMATKAECSSCTACKISMKRCSTWAPDHPSLGTAW